MIIYNPILTSPRNTRDKLSETLFKVYLIEEDMKRISREAKTAQVYEEINLSAFDIHYKIIGNGNGKHQIKISTYEIRCHSDESKTTKTLMARYSKDGSNDFAFVPYSLTQIIINATYMRQIVSHNNYLTAIAVVPIH